ncbi:MAG: hypothetical protein WCJ35_16600 [Planctomycetota bacterium]
MKLIPLLTGLSLFLSPLFARAGTNTLGAPVLQGTNSYSGVNFLTNSANVLAGNGSGITGLTSVVAVAAGTNIVAVTNGQVVTINGTSYVTPSITNGLATTNYVNTATNNAVISASNNAWGGGTMTGPVLTLSSSQFSPAWNEFVTRSNLVNSLTIGSVLYNGSLTNGTNPYTMTNYTYQTTIPADFVRTYSSVAAGSYCGSVSATNLSSLSSPVISTIFLSVSNLQDAARTATFHCELYYSSNIYVTATPLTWYGDYNSQTFTVVGDSKTNTLQSLWTFPTVAFAPNQGVLWRVIKLDSYTGNQAPNIRVFGGTATPSQISFNTPASSSGVGILSANNTWTGTNTFTNPIVATGGVVGGVALSDLQSATNIIATNIYANFVSNNIIVVDTSSSLVTYILDTSSTAVTLYKTNAAYDLKVAFGITTNTISGDGIWVDARRAGSQWIVRW